MFAVIILSKSKKKLVIPIKYVYSFDVTQSMNYGISHTKDHRVFYSKNFEGEPNFKLPLQDEFEEHKCACYQAKILHIFGKFYYVSIFQSKIY